VLDCENKRTPMALFFWQILRSPLCHILLGGQSVWSVCNVFHPPVTWPHTSLTSRLSSCAFTLIHEPSATVDTSNDLLMNYLRAALRFVCSAITILSLSQKLIVARTSSSAMAERPRDACSAILRGLVS